MSAIWGIINLKDKITTDEIKQCITEEGQTMTDSMKRIRFERIDSKVAPGAFMACGHQYYTSEAEHEVLPFLDEKNYILLTADAVLDNRRELLKELCDLTTEDDQTSEIGKIITDSELIYKAFRKYGDDCVYHLRGAYAVVVFDYEKQEITCFNDQCGNRCLYYSEINGVFRFGTLMRPILMALPAEEKQLNEEWFVNCELFYNTEMFYDDKSTMYENVYMFAPGTIYKMTFGSSASIKRYWNPVKEAKKKGTYKYEPEKLKAIFVDTVKAAVYDCLRSQDKTGVTLSSGLDSSTVAAIAADKLSKDNKKLYSFTSIPLEDFKPVEDDDFVVSNEAEGIKPICEMYPNIEPEFVRCEGKSALTEIPHFVEMIEYPTKSNFNMVWIDDIYERASKKGVKVILKGQFGNSTISYGGILSTCRQLVEKGHFIRAYKAAKSFKTRMRVGYKRMLAVAKAELPHKMEIEKSIRERSNLRPEIADKYGVYKKQVLRGCKGGGTAFDSRKQYEDFVYSDIVFEMLGMYDTKLGLEHGIIVRDPTKDPRVIEMCLRMPPDFFVQNGIERFGVRGCMEGIVPQKVRLDINHRGLQSADLVYRTNLSLKYCRTESGEELKNLIITALENETILKLMDAAKLQKFQVVLEQEDMDYETTVDTANIYSLYCFLHQ